MASTCHSRLRPKKLSAFRCVFFNKECSPRIIPSVPFVNKTTNPHNNYACSIAIPPTTSTRNASTDGFATAPLVQCVVVVSEHATRKPPQKCRSKTTRNLRRSKPAHRLQFAFHKFHIATIICIPLCCRCLWQVVAVGSIQATAKNRADGSFLGEESDWAASH